MKGLHEQIQRKKERKAQWAKEIHESQHFTPNPSLIHSAVDSIRSFSTERREKTITPQEFGVFAMNLVCKAISAGAFSGPDWIRFLQRLENDPSYENAIKLCQQYMPDKWRRIAPLMNGTDDGTFLFTCYMDDFSKYYERTDTPPDAQMMDAVLAQENQAGTVSANESPPPPPLNDTDTEIAMFITDHPGCKRNEILPKISREHFSEEIFPRLKARGFFRTGHRYFPPPKSVG